MPFIRSFASLSLDDLPLVRGKNASFGELIRALTPMGVRVPHGFAVTALTLAIEGAHAAGRPIGICGQAPSDHAETAELLVRTGIDSLSLTPDVVVRTLVRIAELEAELDARA